MSGPGLYDPTSIMNTDILNKCMKEGWVCFMAEFLDLSLIFKFTHYSVTFSQILIIIPLSTG